MTETIDPFWFAMYVGWAITLALLVVWAMEEARHLTELGEDE